MASTHRLLLDPEPIIIKQKLSILWFDISDYSKTLQFALCSAAVFVFFLLYGYIQELIFTIEGFQPYGWFLTMIQFGFYSIFGGIEMSVRRIRPKKVPLKTYFLLALLTLGTMGFSNASLGYLNYPTQVIFKCCKLIPVLAGGILIQGKRYGPLDFIAAVLMCVGLTLFILADSNVQPNFNTKGITMISLALLCDAVIGNVQEKSMKKYAPSNVEIVLFSYSLGFMYIVFALLLTGNFMDGFKFFARHPKEIYGYSFLFSVTGYLGIQVVLTLVRSTGAFAAVTVTTCRKAVTIIISFLFFSKPFTFQYLWSGLIVVIGIYLNLFSKKHPVSMLDFEMKVEQLVVYLKSKFIAKKYKSDYYLTNV